MNKATTLRWKEIKDFDKCKYKEKVECICICGEKRFVIKASLINGKSNDCGCGRKKSVADRNKSHGLSKHPLYKVWKNIKSRCFNKNSHHYIRYGARGITICDEWKNNFKSFYEWSISNGYNESLEIDRIDNNGNYDQSNCRFVTAEVNCQNRSSTKLSVEKIKIIKSLDSPSKDISDLFGVSVSMVNNIKRGVAWKNA